MYVSDFSEMANLTKTYIERLPAPPAGQAVFEWDDQQSGLGVRITSGSKSFVYQGRVGGKSFRLTIGAFPTWTVAQARERAREFSVMVDKGIDPRAEKKKSERSGITLEQVVEKFLAERPLKPRTVSDYRRYMDRYLAAWKDRPVATIDEQMIAKRYRDIAASSSGPSQASGAMRFLRSVMNFARDHFGEAVIENNPVAALSRKRIWIKENRRQGHLMANQLKDWLLAAQRLQNPVMSAYLQFVLFSGARRNEAATLKWADVNSRHKTITFRDTKNGDDRVLPVSPYLGWLLGEMNKIKFNAYVFSTSGEKGYIQEPRKALSAINEAAGTQVTVHDLRRTCATILESLNISTYAVKAILGHRAQDVTGQHYTVISVDRLREPMAEYEKFILEKAGLALPAEAQG